MEKIKNIEFLRFIGAIIIMFRHISWSPGALFGLYGSSLPLYAVLRSNLTYSDLWLDLFFIISGFFLFLTTNFDINFKEFFLKKVIRLLPVVIFALVAIKILSLFDLAVHNEFYDFYNILILNVAGILKANQWGNLGHTWFVSCLFWSSMFLFCLAKSIQKNILNILMGLFILFSYTILNTNTTNPVSIYNGFISIGLIRAIGGMSIGYFICEWFKDYQKNKSSNKTAAPSLILFGALELCLFGFIIRNTVLHKLDFTWSILIIAFVTLFMLMLIKKGAVSKILDNNISVLLGKYSYSLFIIHPIIISIFRKTLWQNKEFVMNYPILTISITCIASIIAGILTYHLVEVPSIKVLKKYWLNNGNSLGGGEKNHANDNNELKN